ncbi:MAG: TonB-dependent receptor plug domain-containing protein, partial [Opitutaceae bacterium]|nr:TonB-dependent receptor plug domain-containing protein [Opitutaceae bacterium]
MNSNRKFNAIVRMMIGGVSLAALALSSAFAQAVRNDGAGSGPAAPPPPVVTTTPSLSDEVIMLSPFQVDATREKGYFAENTLAGSRMRTNIADLGAAISVVTKQQMEDTASLDVNDIFRYELGTEGSSTYTPVANSYSSSRKDGLSDNIAGSNSGGGMNAATNATANRIRGLGAPSMALNYYMALDQVPFDSYNTASIEINRGPNSMLFGMGSPAGIVNQSTAQALINKNTGSVQVRVDDRGSERASFSFNKSLIDNKLAIYGAFLYNDQQFERKPSYDITRRQYGAITYKPFKRTTLRASIEGYNNDNRRPNSLTPVDGVTEWRNSGKPVYNALTHEFISLATGQVVSKLASSQYSQNAADVIAYVASQPDFDDTKWDAAKNQYNGISIFGTGAITNINSILYVPGINFHSARTVMQIADGALQRWFQPLSGQRPLISRNPDTYPFVTSGNPADDPNHVYSNPTWANIYDWFQTESAATGMDANPPYAGNKFYPAVTDKSVYDWERVNILSMNFGRQRSTNYNIELEQEILPNLLHFSAGWLRQDFDSMQSYTVSQLNSARLYVDTNILNSDGTPNPYFGRPFVYDQEPDRMEDSQTIDQYRAMLAFTPDFTKNNNWTKWLGRHQFLGLASYMDHERTTFRRRLAYVGGSAETIARYMNNPASATFHMQNNGSRRYFYLSNGGEAVNKASGAYDAGPVVSSITVYDFAQNKFKEIETIMDWIIRSEGTGKSERLLTSYSAGWTGYLWDDRIITTVGVRRDINRTRNTGSPGNSDFGNPKWWTDGVYQYEKAFNDFMSDWSRLSGDTHTYGVVVKPFLHWDSIARRASDNLWWEFVENLGFSYNTSDNFNAPSGTNVDLFGNVLPKPQGEGKDWGVQFSLFKNKLYARVNWFESSNENTPSAGGLQRLHWHMDTTAFRGWLEHIYMLNDGGNPL